MTIDKRRFDGEGTRTAIRFSVIPRHEWVLIKKIFREEKVGEGGVITPAGSRSQRGEVVAASDKTGLKPGDIVIYTNYPIDVADDLEELTGEKGLDLVREEEVYALAVPCE